MEMVTFVTLLPRTTTQNLNILFSKSPVMADRCLNDETLGPAVIGCRGDFDFTQSFAAVVLSIVPVGIFLLVGLLCLSRQCFEWTGTRACSSDVRSKAGIFFYAQQTTILLLVGAKVVYLVAIAASHSLEPRPVSIVSAVLELFAAVLMSPLALCKRSWSRYPSDLLCTFLAITLLFDGARCRTLWLLEQSDGRILAVAVSFTISLFIKMVLLSLLASQSKAQRSEYTDSRIFSPDVTANVFSLSLYWWLNPLLRLGSRRDIGLGDLYPLDPALGCARRAAEAPTKHRTLYESMTTQKLLYRSMGMSGLYPVLPRLIMIACTIAQAILIHRILTLLSHSPDDTNPNTKYGLIGATFLVYSCTALSAAWYGYLHERALTRLRGYLIEHVYLHLTQMPSVVESTSKTSTLIAVDVETIYNGLRNAHELWAVPIQIAVAAWLAYREIGLASLTAVALILASCVTIFAISPTIMARQGSWMATVQSRVSMTSAVLGSIKTLKIAGFSRAVNIMLKQARADEIHLGSYFRLMVSISATFSLVPSVVAPVVVFATNPQQVNAASAFTTLSYLSIMTQPLMTAIQVVPMVLASLVCLRRIRQFLLLPVHVDHRLLGSPLNTFPNEKWSDSEKKMVAVGIYSSSISWAPDVRPVLHNVNVEVLKSTFAVIIGPVGCGKSTLIHAVLGEIPPKDGGVITFRANRVAYCAQTPILTEGTLRHNVIGSLPFNKEKYSEVLEATALMYDLQQLPQGEATRLETGGETLSGGQRRRVALARALYHEPDVLIADDVLSGLDKKTELLVLEKVFGPDGLLRKRGITVLFSTNSDLVAGTADQCIRISPAGDVATQPNLKPFSLARSVNFNGVKTKDAYQGITEDLVRKDADKTVESITEDREEPDVLCHRPTSNVSSDMKTWTRYLSGVGIPSIILFSIFATGFGVCMAYLTVWVREWMSDTAFIHSRSYYLGIYGGIAVACVISNLLMGLIVLVIFVRNAGTTLHDEILQTIMTATLRYLMQTNVGTILTHFSQDLTIVDGQLAGVLVNLAATTTITIGQAVLLVVSSPWMTISYPVLLVILYATRRVYVPTSIRLRFLDLQNKGPLVAHSLNTIPRLPTIRAFGTAAYEVIQNQVLCDRSQRPSYLLGLSQQWLILVNNLVVASLAVILVSLTTFLHVDSGSAGVGLVTLITLSRNLADLVRAYTMVEISLGAVARLKSFTQETPREERRAESVAISETWPERGLVKIANASASYNGFSDQKSLTLREISFTALPGERVAIYGRTGRLLDPIEASAGNTSIDDICIDQLDGTVVREHVISMSQETAFLPQGTTIRENLDPLGQASCQVCQSALETVGLQSVLPQVDVVLESDALSKGQRQLFCLARCIVRCWTRFDAHGTVKKGGLLLLDEVTAHMDEETADRIEDIIDREFQYYTILAVTHKLMDSKRFPRAIVMEGGRIIEDGNADVLFQNEGSHLRELFKPKEPSQETT
ncbi:hypothetical protein BM1_09907 [Bipolaris maydis]|nr:hypothetical protein BM1_09907 [Bipolaris maydis]